MIHLRKRGDETTLFTFSVGTVFCLLVVIALVSCTTILKEGVPVQADRTFQQFVEYYQTCKEYTATNCSCGFFDYSLMPSSYFIQLTNGASNSLLFSLVERDEQDLVRTASASASSLCLYGARSEEPTFDVKNFYVDVTLVKTARSESYPWVRDDRVSFSSASGSDLAGITTRSRALFALPVGKEEYLQGGLLLVQKSENGDLCFRQLREPTTTIVGTKRLPLRDLPLPLTSCETISATPRTENLASAQEPTQTSPGNLWDGATS